MVSENKGGQRDDLLKKVKINALKAILPVLLLRLIRKGMTHGYDIAQYINSAGGVVSQSQVYATLARLEKDGYVISEWTHSDRQSVRKTYSLTGRGSKAESVARDRILEIVRQTWA